MDLRLYRSVREVKIHMPNISPARGPRGRLVGSRNYRFVGLLNVVRH